MLVDEGLETIRVLRDSREQHLRITYREVHFIAYGLELGKELLKKSGS